MLSKLPQKHQIGGISYRKVSKITNEIVLKHCNLRVCFILDTYSSDGGCEMYPLVPDGVLDVLKGGAGVA